MRIWLFDIKDWAGIEPAKEAVSRRLAERGYRSEWRGRLPLEFDEDDIILAHTPLQGWRNVTHLCVLGMRLIDRRQRLAVLDRVGVPMPAWAAPRKWDEAMALFDAWDTPAILHKSDRSFRRRGVTLVRPDTTPFEWESGDVFMRIVDGPPDTYKVALFGEQPIAMRRLGTRSVFDPDFVGARSDQELVELDDEAREIARAVGRAMLPLGTGYMSIDLMRDGGRWKVIEANTCSIGRKTSWGRWPEAYGLPYGDGIADWLDAGAPRATLEEYIAAALSVDDTTP